MTLKKTMIETRKREKRRPKGTYHLPGRTIVIDSTVDGHPANGPPALYAGPAVAVELDHASPSNLVGPVNPMAQLVETEADVLADAEGYHDPRALFSG